MYICVYVLRKNLDLIQINYEALINFNIGTEKYPNYACADVKQLQLIGKVRYHETIVKNNSGGFSSSEQELFKDTKVQIFRK